MKQGQEQAYTRLLQWWDSGRIPHAILLKGKHGWGSMVLARQFIQYMFCTQKNSGDACGVCDNCLKNLKAAHPDVHYSFPSISPKSGVKAMSQHFMSEYRDFVQTEPYASSWDWLQFIQAENKQGNISAEECRYIIDQLNLTAYEGGWKVQVIWMPEYLKENGNILLKLMEEPPSKTIIILVAEQTEPILSTILSRVQQVSLQPFSSQWMSQKLNSLFPESAQDQIQQVVQWSEGDFYVATKMLEAGVSNYLAMVRNWFNGIFANNQFNLIHEFVEEAHHLGREHIKAILNYSQQLLADLIRLKYRPAYIQEIVTEEAQFLTRFEKLPLAVDQLYQMQEQIAQSVYFIERNVHTKTQLMALSFRLQGIYRNLDFEEATL